MRVLSGKDDFVWHVMCGSLLHVKVVRLVNISSAQASIAKPGCQGDHVTTLVVVDSGCLDTPQGLQCTGLLPARQLQREE